VEGASAIGTGTSVFEQETTKKNNPKIIIRARILKFKLFKLVQKNEISQICLFNGQSLL
jgi:hypothetical protein